MAASDSVILIAAAALFGAAVAVWWLSAPFRPRPRLYLRFAAMLLSALAVAVPLDLADVLALLTLPLASTSLAIATLARFARPLPVGLAALALVAALAAGMAALLFGIWLAALCLVLLAGLAIIAAAFNVLAVMPMLAGSALLASALVYLEDGVSAGLLLFCAAALLGASRGQLLRSTSSAMRASRALP